MMEAHRINFRAHRFLLEIGFCSLLSAAWHCLAIECWCDCDWGLAEFGFTHIQNPFRGAESVSKESSRQKWWVFFLLSHFSFVTFGQLQLQSFYWLQTCASVSYFLLYQESGWISSKLARVTERPLIYDFKNLLIKQQQKKKHAGLTLETAKDSWKILFYGSYFLIVEKHVDSQSYSHLILTLLRKSTYKAPLSASGNISNSFTAHY